MTSRDAAALDATRPTSGHPVLGIAPLDPPDAARHLRERLALSTDPSDVRAALQDGDRGFVVVDTRTEDAWDQGHVPGALRVHHRDVDERLYALIPRDAVVVTYCWGNGCNGSTRGALAFALLGYRVKEMIGGIEYWTREGFPVETATGLVETAPDPLTAPAGAGVTCGCG